MKLSQLRNIRKRRGKKFNSQIDTFNEKVTFDSSHIVASKVISKALRDRNSKRAREAGLARLKLNFENRLQRKIAETGLQISNRGPNKAISVASASSEEIQEEFEYGPQRNTAMFGENQPDSAVQEALDQHSGALKLFEPTAPNTEENSFGLPSKQEQELTSVVSESIDGLVEEGKQASCESEQPRAGDSDKFSEKQDDTKKKTGPVAGRIELIEVEE